LVFEGVYLKNLNVDLYYADIAEIMHWFAY